MQGHRTAAFTDQVQGGADFSVTPLPARHPCPCIEPLAHASPHKLQAASLISHPNKMFDQIALVHNSFSGPSSVPPLMVSRHLFIVPQEKSQAGITT